MSPKSCVTTLFHALFIFIELILHLHAILEVRLLKMNEESRFPLRRERHKRM